MDSKRSEDDSSGNKISASASGDVSSSSTNNRTGSISFNMISNFFIPFREIVSQNRRRFVGNGYDLDLTYVTDRIIAMGYPADDNESFYRNEMNKVRSFLDSRHSDHYTVFNLRGNYQYDVAKFHNRVYAYAMTDHHPPRLEFMAPFCQQVDDFLKEDPRNVVAVHCKAGKGRTGVMICAYLVHINFYPSPRQVMDYYSIARTRNNKGVTIPSQRRYVYYFSHLKNKGLKYLPLRQELMGIYIENPPKIKQAFYTTGFGVKVANCGVDVFTALKARDIIWFKKKHWSHEGVTWGGTASSTGPGSYDSSDPYSQNNIISRRGYGWTVPRDKRVFIQGDVRIDLYTRKELSILKWNTDKEKVGHVWLNTMFMCPDFCGGEFRHGDELHPYPEGATSLAEKKNTVRPKAGSASLPNTPAGSLKKRDMLDKTNRFAKRTPSFDTRKDCGRSSRFTFNSAIRRFGDRRSEPSVEPKCSSARTEKDKRNAVDSLLWTDDNMDLTMPPGLQEHCPDPEVIYGNLGSQHPRLTIEKHLREAHKQDLVDDAYNRKKHSVTKGEPVAMGDEGKPSGSGPHIIRKEADEHVHYFPVCEIDRACKEKYDQRFKIIVVTRCIPENEADRELANNYLKLLQDNDADILKKKSVGGNFCMPQSSAFDEKVMSHQCSLQLRHGVQNQKPSTSKQRSEPVPIDIRARSSAGSFSSTSSRGDDVGEVSGDAFQPADDTL